MVEPHKSTSDQRTRLPARTIRYVDDITSVDAHDEIIYTVQDAGAVPACDDVHSFPPPAEGTVDLLIPADWFATGEGTHTSPLELIDNPAKFVVCGPRNGYSPYAIWGPASADAADVNVTVEPDGRRLTVQIGTQPDSTTELPDIEQDDADAAEAVVSEFLDDLRHGDPAAAAGRWTGYSELGPDASTAEKTAFIDGLVADPVIQRILEGDAQTSVTASWGWTTATPVVVTVLAPRNGDDPTGRRRIPDRALPGAGRHRHRVDPPPPANDPTPSSRISPGRQPDPGQQIVVAGAPLEGGARAYIDSREIPVEVDHANLTMIITLPSDIEGDVRDHPLDRNARATRRRRLRPHDQPPVRATATRCGNTVLPGYGELDAAGAVAGCGRRGPECAGERRARTHRHRRDRRSPRSAAFPALR